MSEDIEPLLTASQVAEICGLGRASIYAAVSKNLIPAVVLWKGKRRRVVRFRRADVEAWLRSSSVSVDISQARR